jgi:hypothetical protein
MMTQTHLVGTLDVTSLPTPAPELANFETPAWELGEIDVLHVNYEISANAIQSSVPPALHPSIPPHLSWLVYRVKDSSFGPFTLAQTRVGCRIGLKPRGLLLSAFCDNATVGRQLRSRWGFDVRAGDLVVSKHADQIELRVRSAGRDILALDVVDPTLLPGGAVPIAAGLNLARTAVGTRLVQVDPEYVIASAERGKVKLRTFDAAAWGDPTIVPTWPISGSFMRAEVTLPRLRYLTDPTSTSADGTTRLRDPEAAR